MKAIKVLKIAPIANNMIAGSKRIRYDKISIPSFFQIKPEVPLKISDVDNLVVEYAERINGDELRDVDESDI